MFEKRIPLKTQLAAIADLSCESVEVHFDLVVRQLVAVSQIADAWRRLRHCYQTTNRKERKNRARELVDEIFLYLAEMERLVIERLDYVDPSTIGTDEYTDRMDVELEAFESAMAAFVARPVPALCSQFPCAFAAVRNVVECVQNRLRLAANAYDGDVDGINWHENRDDIDFEDLTKDFPNWFDLKFDDFHALLRIERARMIKFLLVHASKLATARKDAALSSNAPLRLNTIPIGIAGATAFHHWVGDAITYACHHSLRRQAREYRIHEGRKRIDLVFTNMARTGFFHRLDQRLRVFAPFIFVECKNLRNDPTNQDFDQLAGRFSDRRGHFGFLICRTIKNRANAIRRARDIRDANRGVIIVVAADELAKTCGSPTPESAFEDLIERRYHELIM